MARVEARGMLPLGGQARPKGGYVTLHGLCAKLPVPAQTLTILRHNTNFFARHTPHSHTLAYPQTHYNALVHRQTHHNSRAHPQTHHDVHKHSFIFYVINFV